MMCFSKEVSSIDYSVYFISPLYSVYSAHSVYTHELPPCEKRFILFDYMSQGCRGAKMFTAALSVGI